MSPEEMDLNCFFAEKAARKIFGDKAIDELIVSGKSSQKQFDKKLAEKNKADKIWRTASGQKVAPFLW